MQLVVTGLQVRQLHQAGQRRGQVVQTVVRHVQVQQRHQAPNIPAGVHSTITVRHQHC